VGGDEIGHDGDGGAEASGISPPQQGFSSLRERGEQQRSWNIADELAQHRRELPGDRVDIFTLKVVKDRI